MFLQDINYIKQHAIYHIPTFIKNEYPLFVKLLEHFYDFMEKEGNVLHGMENLHNHNSLVSPYNKFWEEIYMNAGFPFSDQLQINPRQFMNYLMDFYMARGSVQGLKFIIKCLYGVEITVSNPRDEMLIPSQAEYIDNQFICVKLKGIPVNIFRNLKERIEKFSLSVKSNSTDEALDIENLYISLKEGNVFLNLKVNHKGVDKFIPGEQLTIFSDDGFLVTGINCPVINIHIDNPGKYYQKGDRILLGDAPVTKGMVYVAETRKGGIDIVGIDEGGSGYKVGDYLYTSKGGLNDGAYGFYATISSVDASGAIRGIKVHNPGDGYYLRPTVSVYSKTGSGAKLTPVSHKIGGIKRLEYRENFTIDLTKYTEDDLRPFVAPYNSDAGGAKISTSFSATGKTSSFYRTNQGVLNSSSYLTDSLYYQQFSYKINSTLPRYRYDKLVDELSHPAGYVRYAGYLIADNKKRINLIKKTKFTKE